MFRLRGPRLEGFKSLCVSDQLFTFLDLDMPWLAVNTRGKAQGTRPNSTYLRGSGVNYVEAAKTKHIERLLVFKVTQQLTSDFCTTCDTT